MKKFLFIVLLGLASLNTNGQITQDSLQNNINRSSLQLPDAPSIQELYTYDPKTNLFYLSKKVGDFHLSYPWVLTPKEYYNRVIKEAMNKKFKEYNQAISGKGKNAEKLRKNLLPVYYVNSKFFESLFGGNKVDIQPTGSLSLDLGLRYTKRDNPAIPVKNRTNTSLIFDQKIQMGLKGKIGTRLSLDLNYDTQSTFDFNNQVKLQYTPNEDDILQNIELGNVNLQTTNSLIHGAQSLFGLKTEFQFGKTYITTVFAEQKSGMHTIQAQGDEVITDFETPILKYEENKHYFLAQYFRKKYTEAVKNYPFINSNARITRIEVWKTNRSNQTENIRNIVALQDLGENQLLGLDVIPPGFILNPSSPPDNSVNKLDPSLIPTGTGALNPNIRNVYSVSQGFNGITPENGTDYIMLENAVKLDSSQFKLHPQLGYITLKQNLAADEVLAVAFEYSINGQLYRVGEFSDNGIIYPQNIVVKLLKSNMVSTSEPNWALMMKNIYNIDAYDIKPDDFRLNILYANPTPFNYIRPINGTPLPSDVKERILLNVFNMDRLNFQMDPQPKGDGFFDFIPGITIDPRDGLIIFTSTEPFGKYLFEKLRLSPTEDYDNVNTWNENQKHYVFKELYTLSKTQAEQYTSKNKFLLKGKYKTAGGDGIPIGGLNIPRGSVTVTAGGRTLIEGVDYVVNYPAGRVNIINPAIKQANVPVQVSVEQNTIFQQTTKIFKGINIEHKFNDNFFLGGTYMSFKEKPLSWKSNYGNEPLNNTLIGFNGAYSTKVPLLTRLINRLPNIATDVESNFSIKAEAAYLFPGLSKVSEVNGRSTTYVEDFESSQMFIDLRSPYAWKLASVPARFPESSLVNDLNSGKNRAKLAWYIIDPIFYTNPPDDIDQNELSKPENRQILITEIFDQDIPSGYPTTVNPLNLVFFPTERGPYNFDVNIDPNTGKLLNPQQRWGGIMRYLQTNDFEQANVEYIEIWVMDPYYNNPTPPPGGKLYIDLGYVSEDILPDGRKQYENGLPGDGSDNNVVITNIARVPAHQSLVYAFSNDPDERPNQDVGLDGFPNSREKVFYASFLNSLPANLQNLYQNDPSADDFKSYLEAQGSIIDRYKNYNGTEGNTPINAADKNTKYTTGNNTYPDVEDIDKDQSMNTIESYFEYEVEIKPNITVNDPFVSDIREKTVGLPNGDQIATRWIQYKIPIHQYTSSVGSISDFRSIKFMRMYLNGFQEDQLVLRFAALNLVRGDWRKYQLSLDPTDPNPNDDGTIVETSSVSIEDNYARQPIPYVLPPGIEREEIYQQNANIRQNEQALSLKICNLEPKDARGVYKYNSIDMRQYKRLEMFIHAESIQGKPALQDNEAVGFIRFGSDLTDNFYEVQIPLKVTPFGATTPEEIWPEENRIDLKLELLNKIKLELIRTGNIGNSNSPLYFPEAALDPSAAGKPNPLTIGIKGNPNYGDVKVIMVGIKNRSDNPICGEFWFNEMRLSEMKNQGGWAGNASVDTNLADFATLSFTGGISTEGFGGLEQGPLERNLEDSKRYNFNSSVNVGQLLPKKWNLKIPVNYTVSEEFIRPKYDPIWRDIPLEERLSIASSKEKDSILQVAQTYTRHRGITLAGVRKDYSTTPTKSGPPGAKNQKTKTNKKHFFDIENFTFDFAYNELFHSDYEVKSNSDQQARLGVNYSYNFKEHSFRPFKKSKKLKKKYFKLLSDFNFNLLPSNISLTSNINRRFNNLNFRQIEDYGLDIPPLQNRDYRFDWGYTVNYNPTKSITASFGITHNRSIKNYILPDGTTDFNNNLWSNFFDIGSPLIHNQNVNVSYKLPINKIPMLDFIQSTYVYNGSFQWNRRSEALANVNGYDLGNTIQNSNSHQLNSNLDLRKLYRSLGITQLKNELLGKRKRKPRKKKKKKTEEKKKQEIVSLKNKQETKNTLKKKPVKDYTKPNGTQKFMGHLLEIFTGFQNFKLNYRQNNGNMLPGYLPGVGFAGTLKPSIPFALGWDDDKVRYEAAKRGWLTQYPDFNEPYINSFTEEMSYQGMYKPYRSFSITIKGQKTYMENISEQFNAVGNQYHALLPHITGNHSISTVLVKTAFEKISLENSPAYQRMLDYRPVIARRLAQQRGIPIPSTGYPTGYGPLQTEVVLYSFLAGYSGKSPQKVKLSPFRNIPIPNWRIKVIGLNKIGVFKKWFKNLSIEHSYRSDYTINQFNNNLQTFINPNALDASGNFYFKYVMDNVTLTEAFNPLIKINMEMNNSLKMDIALKTDRAISLNLNNYTLSEVAGKEYVLGLGYRFKDVSLPLTISGRRVTFTNDLILKINASIRDNITIIRSLSENNNQITAGQTMYNFKLSADYALTNNLSAIFFYTHSFSKFAISTNYPFTNIRGGITLKYSFGN